MFDKHADNTDPELLDLATDPGRDLLLAESEYFEYDRLEF